MNTCPNVHSKEWKDLIKALKDNGLSDTEAEKVAYDDYMHFEDIRPADAVIQRYNNKQLSNQSFNEVVSINENINQSIAENKYNADNFNALSQKESVRKQKKYTREEKKYLNTASYPSFVTRVTDDTTHGGRGTNIDDFTRQPIVYIHEKNDNTLWIGRQMYSSEIFALSELSPAIVNLNNGRISRSQRYYVQDQIETIAEKFNVDIRPGDMFMDGIEMVQMYCFDFDFLDYLMYSINSEGKFIGTPEGFDFYLKSLGYADGIKAERRGITSKPQKENSGRTRRPKAKTTKNTEALQKFEEKNKKLEDYLFSESVNNYVYFTTGQYPNWTNSYDMPSRSVYDKMTEEEISAMALMNESSNKRKFKDAVEYFEHRRYNFSDMENENMVARLYNIHTDENDSTGSEELVRQLSENLGISYEFISIPEAEKLLANTKTPFNSSTDASFFFNGKVYFIKGRFDKHLAMHEFSHPFIQMIYQSNRPLFDKLYSDLQTTETGKAIISMVKDLYAQEYDFEDGSFKEECLVMAIEYMSRDDVKNDSPFMKFIKNLLYHIRHMLRSVFGNEVNLSGLDTDTTLGDLYEILKGSSKINISKRDTTFDDIAKFSHSYNELIDEIENSYENSDLAKAIDVTFDVYKDYSNQLDWNKDFEQLKFMHKNFFNTTDFQESFRSIRDVHDTKPLNQLTHIVSENQLLKLRAHTLGKSIVTISKMSKDILGVIIDLNNTELNQEAVQQIYSYNKLLDYWSKKLKELHDIFTKQTSLNNPEILNSYIGNAEENVNKCQELINNMFLDIATDVIYDELQTKYQKMNTTFKERIKNLQDAHVPQQMIDKAYKEYIGMTQDEYEEFLSYYKRGVKDTDNTEDSVRFAQLKMKSYDGLIKSKAQIRDCIKGELGDVNYMNSKFEGYLYSVDPVIGGFASFLRDQLTQAEQRTQKRFNELFQKIAPELQKLDMKKMQVGEFGKTFLFKDTVLSKDKDGKYVRKQIWTFLNPFKDYRADYDEYENSMKEARDAWEKNTNDETYKNYLQKKMEFDAFKITYMHQEYVPEYYIPYLRLLNNPAGQAALVDKERLDSQIRMLRLFKNDPSMSNAENWDEQIEELEFQKRRLTSLYNLDNTEKSKESLNGEPSEYDKAMALRRFNEESAKFTDYEIDTESFDKDFISFYKSLIDQGYVPNTETFNDKISQWERKYMKAELKPEIREKVNRILDEMSNVSKILNPQAAEEMKKLRSLVAGTIDNFGEAMENFRQEWQAQIQQAQQAIVDSRNGSARLYRLFKQLDALVYNVPTRNYLDQLKYQMEQMEKSILEECGFSDQLDVFASQLEEQHDSQHPVENLFVYYPQFKKWFNENHVKHTSEFEGVQSIRYSRIFCHNRMKARDASNEESYTVIDPDSNTVIATLHGLPGYRYRRSYVRDEYRNEKVEGVTVDNKGKPLPRLDAKDKKYINEDYMNMDRNSPEFKILEELKRVHLEAQKDSPYSSRLYLDLPRFRTELKEILVAGAKEGLKNTLSLFLKRMKMFFTGGADDFEFGASNSQKNIMQEVLSVDSMDDEFSHIPVSGRYDLDIEDVSTNVFRSIFRYYASLDRENNLRDVAPVSKAIQQSVEDGNIRIERYKKGTSAIRYLTQSDNFRRDAINNLIEREYQGITLKGPFKDSVAAQNIINFLFGRASFSFFAMNIPSALKNSFGIKFQALLESSTGKHLTAQALSYGNLWSYEAMGEMTFGGFYNSREAKSIKRRIVEAFDMQGQDIAGDTFMDPLWRSFGTDILDGKLLYFPRKWVEQQATCQVGAAILYKNKVNRFVNGQKSVISYIDAFEVVDGNLKIKQGVDIRYALEATDYNIDKNDTFDSLMKKFNLEGREGMEYLCRMLGVDSADIDKLQDADDQKAKRVLNILGSMKLDNIKIELEQAYENYEYKLNNISPKISNMERQRQLEAIESEYFSKTKSLRVTLKNTKFLDIHKEIMQVNNDLGGAYSRFDQPDMYRNIIFRFCAYMRRYFTTMFMSRFRLHSRYNPGLGEQQRGFYIQTLDFLIDIFKTGGRNILVASNEEKKAMIKFGTEMVMLMAIPLLCSFLFGFDPDDEDRYKKLRKKSGALSAPFVEDDKNRDFNLLGFTELHALHLLMQIRQENEQFNPFCGGVKQLNSMLDLKSVVWGPTTDSFTQILEDMKKTIQDDPKAYYTRDIGPYEWHKKGSNKTFNHLAKMFGFTGTSLDPALAIQNLQANISKIHR